jgi:hypothetical protein
MAEIVEGGGGDGKHGKKKAKKGSARIDMTPMVDLAFLLLTFFVLAATLAKPKAMEILYPKEVDDDKDQTKVKAFLTTTILLGEDEDEIFYYEGVYKKDSTQLKKTDLSKDGVRKLMLEKNKDIIFLVDQLKEKVAKKEITEEQYDEAYKDVVGGDNAAICIIKTLPKTKYKNVISSIDELNICSVRKRAIQDMTEDEEGDVLVKSTELNLRNN